MSLTIKVKHRIPDVTDDVEQKVADAIRTSAFEIEGYAKQGVPPRVDTGYMMNSINANGDGSTWRVDAPAEYAIYHEFGTRHLSAHPFMVPALHRVIPRLRDRLRGLA